MTKNEPAVVDARGMRCPWPALRLARAMRDTDAAVLIADDPKAGVEAAALAAANNWHCLIEALEPGERISVKRRAAA